MSLSIFDVAKYFLTKVDHDAGEVMTPLKLQKIVYYAQAWHLALVEEPLMNAEFQAWAHGPVNPQLYHEYKDYGWSSIPYPDDFNAEVIDKDNEAFLDEVWEVYGRYGAKYLEQLTHKEKPWTEARGGIPDGHYCSTPLNENTMKFYYRDLMEDDEED